MFEGSRCGVARCPKSLGIWAARNEESMFRLRPSGILSVKTGVGGNSTTGSSDAMDNDSEKTPDEMEARDSDQLIGLSCDDKLVLLVLPAFCRCRLAMRAINSGSFGFLGSRGSCEVMIHGTRPRRELWKGSWNIVFVLGISSSGSSS